MAKRKLGLENPWQRADTTVVIVPRDLALAEILSSPSLPCKQFHVVITSPQRTAFVLRT